MKKQIKRITAFAAAVAMAAAFTFPAEIGDGFFGFGNVIVASAESSGEWVYTVNAYQTVTITGYQGSGGAVEIPAVIDGKSVTSIGDRAFYGCTKLTSITIPYGVTSIGDYAFESCTGLESITIPDRVTSIGEDAFRNCPGLKRITIPDGVTSIGNGAFENCFELTSINIPDGVTSIGTNAFYGCSGLTSITVDSSNSSYCSESGVLFNKNKTALICYPAGKTDSSYKIPDEVTSIEYAAFEACTGLTSITIGGGVTSIGDYAFERCTGLGSITIPNSVTSIGYAAFNYCTGLTIIYIPDGISIGQHAIPSTAARITYIVNSDGSVTITKIELTNGQNTIDIPAAINGKTVIAVEEGYRSCVGNHTCASSTPATCINEAACGICGQDYYGDHNISHHDAAAHTCTADGTIEYWECSVCGKYFSDADGTTEITNIVDPNDPAPGHNWDTAYDSNETHHWHNCTNANCPITENNQKDGYAVHTPGAAATETTPQTCTECGYELAPALGHIHAKHLKFVAEVSASCTTDGVKAHYECDCGKLFSDADDTVYVTAEELKIAAHHTYGKDWVSDNDENHYHACSKCGDKTDVTAHSYDNGMITTPATETTEGVKTYTCSVCNHTKTETVPKLSHTHSLSEDYSKDETGHWHTCSGCDEKVDFEAHTEDSGTVTVQPTAYTTGVRVYSCSVCGYVLRTETIPAAGMPSYPTYPTYPTYTTYPVVSTPSVFTEKLTVKAELDGGTATLGWDKVENADKYYVYQYKDGKYVEIKTTTDTSVTFKGLKNGKTYKFLVRYSIGGKLSPMTYSDKITVKVYYKPIAKATSTENSIKLTWRAVPNAEKYAVYKYVDGKAVKLCETEKLAVRINKLTPDTKYQYIVRAYVDGKWTSMKKSDIVTFKTKAE